MENNSPETNGNVIYQPTKRSPEFVEMKHFEEICIEDSDKPRKIETGDCCDSFLDTCSRCANCCTQWCFCYRLTEQNF